MRFVPAMGLLLSSPMIYQAVLGQRPMHEALVVWLLAMVLAALGWWLWSAATRPSLVEPLEVLPMDDARLRRREDGAG